jgi:hypothetical protein
MRKKKKRLSRLSKNMNLAPVVKEFALPFVLPDQEPEHVRYAPLVSANAMDLNRD